MKKQNPSIEKLNYAFASGVIITIGVMLLITLLLDQLSNCG